MRSVSTPAFFCNDMSIDICSEASVVSVQPEVQGHCLHVLRRAEASHESHFSR